MCGADDSHMPRLGRSNVRHCSMEHSRSCSYTMHSEACIQGVSAARGCFTKTATSLTVTVATTTATASFSHCSFVAMQATVPVLWLMPALQLLLLLFFTTVAVSHWIYSWLLLAPCLITGAVRSLVIARPLWPYMFFGAPEPHIMS